MKYVNIGENALQRTVVVMLEAQGTMPRGSIAWEIDALGHVPYVDCVDTSLTALRRAAGQSRTSTNVVPMLPL